MLPIEQHFLNCAIYIYKTIAHANSGEYSGGSGFMVHVPYQDNPERGCRYAVSARHVVDELRNPVLRLNLKSGHFDLFETNRERWILHPDNDDLAVYPFEPTEEVLFSAVSLEEFYDPSRMREVFPGDEVFMVGRFLSHEGRERNAPSLRFGNISMLPVETMESKYKECQETYLVEHHSLPGYSGSPVFVVIDPTKARPPHWMTPINHSYDPRWHGPWLLGIDWMHINAYEAVRDGESSHSKKIPDRFVKSHSGMAGVIPATSLEALLNDPRVKAQRDKDDARISEGKVTGNYISYDPADSDAVPDSTKQDFDVER